MTPEKRSPAPALQSEKGRAEGNHIAVPSITAGAESEADFAAALAGESIAEAARLIALSALSAEGAARRGDMPLAFDKLRLVAHALDEARSIVMLAGRISK
jgi:hypothetical protein